LLFKFSTAKVEWIHQVFEGVYCALFYNSGAQPFSAAVHKLIS